MEPILPPKLKQKIKQHRHFSFFGISSAEKSFFIENLALLIDSDMGVSYTLETLEGDAKSSSMRKAIGQMRQALNNGDPFWKAIQAPGIFPSRLITLIKTGEDTGTLSESLKSVDFDMKKDKKFRSKLQSAHIYPTIVILVTIVVALIASATVLPSLTAIFKNSNVPLPFSTKVLIAFGSLMAARGIYITPLVFIFLVLGYYIL